jgi:hypothetical protein
MMADCIRFCEGNDDDARRLMLAMRDERPPEGARARAFAALGVGGAATITSGAALASAASATAGKSFAWLAVKWLGAGAVVGAVATTGAAILGAPSEHSSVAVPQPAATAPAAPGATPSEPARPLRAIGKPNAVADQLLARRAVAPNVAQPVQPPPRPLPAPAPTAAIDSPAAPARAEFAPAAEDSLDREIQVLDAARHALQGSAPDVALAELDRHAREFPRGRLSVEAFVVRLDALGRAGRGAEARTLAERYLSAHPTSPHADRIRKLTGLAR